MLTGKSAKAFVCAGVIAAGSFAVSGNAQAQSNAEMMRIIQQLQQQVQQLQNQVQTNTANAEEAKEQAAAAQETAKSSGGMEYKWGPSMTFKSPDGRFEMHVRGRIMVDFGYVGNDVVGEDDRFATEFRRARLGVEGKAWKDIKYKFEIDFADNEVDIADAYIQYRGWKPIRITIGQFKETVSLDEQTSSRQITVVERAGFTDAFGFSRRIGVGMDGEFGDFGVQLGIFGSGEIGDNENSEGYAFTGRLWWEPQFEGGTVHIGGSFRFRDLDNDIDGEEVRYRHRPVAHVSERFVSTDTLEGVKSDTFYGAELAASFGPFFAAGEVGFLEGKIQDGFEGLYNGEDSYSLFGAYGEVGWFITGENRPLSGGDWGRPKVNNPVFEGGMGTWVVAFRLDYLDLNDFDAGINGGEQLSYIFNVSWYLNRHTRFILAYAHNDISDGVCPVNVSCNFGDAIVNADGDAKVDTVMGRFQVDW